MTSLEQVALAELCSVGFVRVEFRGVESFGYRVSPVGGSEDGQELLGRLKDLGYAELIPLFKHDRGDHGWRATPAGHRKTRKILMRTGANNRRASDG